MMHHLVHLIDLLTEDRLGEEVTAGHTIEVVEAFLRDWANLLVMVKVAQVDILVSPPWLPSLHGVKSL